MTWRFATRCVLLFVSTLPWGDLQADELPFVFRDVGQEVGSIVRAYTAGHAGESEFVLASEEVSTGYGFCSGQSAIAHLGMENLCLRCFGQR